MACALVCVHAQQHTVEDVHGKVTDAISKLPLNGAVVELWASKKKAVTDKNGGFAIDKNTGADTLTISHIGYVSKALFLQADRSGFLSVSLEPATQELGNVDVVQTGYQTIARERATGSFEKVGNKELNQLSGFGILARLEGVSSILFDKNGSRPPISIRGYASIESSNAPLIILDNFPYEGDINNINPNDVEDVTILKDAAAASIWGTRAGNGVIVINTKKGKYQQPVKIGFNTNFTTVQKPDLFYKKLMSSSDFIDAEQFIYGKGYFTSQIGSSSRPALSPAVEILTKQTAGQLSAADAVTQIDALRGTDVRNDFERYLYRDAIYQQYSINASGGSTTVSWLMSAGYDRNLDQLSDGLDRYNTNLQNMFRPTNNLEIGTGITYTNSKNRLGNSPYSTFYNLYPYAKLADVNGNALPVGKLFRQSYIDTAGQGKLLDWNYYPLTDDGHINNTTSIQDILINISAKYRFSKWLSMDVRYQYEGQNTDYKNYRDTGSYYVRNLVNQYSQLNRATGAVKYIVPDGGIADLSSGTLDAQKARAQLNMNRTWGRNNVVALAGAEISQSHSYSNSSTLYGYNPDLATVSSVDYANPYPNYVTGFTSYVPNTTQVTDRRNRFVSEFANAAYTYDSRYTISGSTRRDASNLFGVNSNDRWQPLWSAGAAWAVSNEKFYHWQWLPYLKIRGTMGYSGNVNTLKSAVTTLRYSPFAANFTNLPYASVVQYADPDLRWEKTRTMNAGLDFATKNRGLTGSFDVYFKKGTDLFGPTPFDYTTGTPSTIDKNVADMNGHGLEISLNAKVIDQKFKWNSQLLFNYATTKLVRYYNTSALGSSFVSDGSTIKPLVGRPLFSLLTYKWAGLDSAGNPKGIVGGKASTDYTAITGLGTPINALVYGGQATPPVYGNWTNVFLWKGFSLTANISYRLDYYFQKQSVNYTSLFLGVVQPADFKDRWQKPGDENIATVPSMVYPANSNRDIFYAYSSVLTRKADNIRLQYINLGYSLNRKMLKTMPFENIQMYVNITGLGILWRANKDGLDPDYDSSYPPSRSIAIGLRTNL